MGWGVATGRPDDELRTRGRISNRVNSRGAVADGGRGELAGAAREGQGARVLDTRINEGER